MKVQLLVDVDLGAETSPSAIAYAFTEAIYQVAYAYGSISSWKYLGDVACSWHPTMGPRLIRDEGRLWQSVAMLTNDNNKNIWEVKQ